MKKIILLVVFFILPLSGNFALAEEVLKIGSISILTLTITHKYEKSGFYASEILSVLDFKRV